MQEPRPASIAAIPTVPGMERPTTDRELFSWLTVSERREALELLLMAEEQRGYLALLGTTPISVFRGLMGADYILRNGSPDQKIAVIFQFLRDYDIDVEGLRDAIEIGYVPARPINNQ